MPKSKDYLAGRIEGLLYADQIITQTAEVYIQGDQDFEVVILKAIDDIRGDLVQTDKEYSKCVS